MFENTRQLITRLGSTDIKYSSALHASLLVTYMYIESVIAYICPYKFMQVSFLTTQFTLHQDTVLVPKMYVKCASKEPCYVAIYAAIKVFFLRVHYSVVVLSVVLSLVVIEESRPSSVAQDVGLLF